jgi:arylsulfatase
VVDFMPTLLELAGGKYPEAINGKRIPAMEGESLVPSMRDREQSRKAPLYWALFGNRAVRDGKWKLVWGASDQRWELYDLSIDRSETTDLALKHPGRVKEMSTTWVTWAERTENTKPQRWMIPAEAPRGK